MFSVVITVRTNDGSRGIVDATVRHYRHPVAERGPSERPKKSGWLPACAGMAISLWDRFASYIDWTPAYARVTDSLQGVTT
jgi:hypothetical protein